MNLTGIFHTMPLALFFFGTVVFLLASVEAGMKLAKVKAHGEEREQQAPIGSLVGSILGLLAFILAFTFGMTASRFEQRRQLLLDEANAISTVYLTSSLAPAAESTEMRRILREYIAARVGLNQENLQERLERTTELQRQLWRQTERFQVAKMAPDLLAHFADKMTALLDLHQSRMTVGLQYRIPGSIWLALFFLAAIGMLAIGYQVGAAGSRRLRGMPALAIAFALVFCMIADIDRPTEGQFRVSDKPLRDVQDSMR